jgi:transcriptional regulator with XRE-family HTH domain
LKKGGKEMPRISLAAARVNAKLTQRELAEKLEVSQTTINNWENGVSEPSLSQLRKISELSGIPMDFLFVEK